jgi:hypothetical protein
MSIWGSDILIWHQFMNMFMPTCACTQSMNINYSWLCVSPRFPDPIPIQFHLWSHSKEIVIWTWCKHRRWNAMLNFGRCMTCKRFWNFFQVIYWMWKWIWFFTWTEVDYFRYLCSLSLSLSFCVPVCLLCVRVTIIKWHLALNYKTFP